MESGEVGHLRDPSQAAVTAVRPCGRSWCSRCRCALVAASGPNFVPVPQYGDAPSEAPKSPGLCAQRPGLFGQIDVPRAAGVSIWLVARAGAGKTTLVQTYAAARDRLVVRHCLSPTDADCVTFLDRFARAFERVIPGVAVVSPGPVDRTSARRFFEALFTHVTRPSIVLFDDVHVLPSPAFSRLRVSDRLAVIDDAPLRFDATEAQALLRKAGSILLSRSPAFAASRMDGLRGSPCWRGDRGHRVRCFN